MDSLGSARTYDPDITNPDLYPGWRGQYDYKNIAAVSVAGTKHNVAIQGLFTYIDPAGAQATTLQGQGYVKTNWGIDIVNNFASYQYNILSGITLATDPPRIYHSIPSATTINSKGKITNGYGLPN